MRSGVRIACFYMHARRVGTVNLDAEEHQESSGYALYESLLIYVAHSRRRSASRYLPRTCIQDSLLRFVRYSTKDIVGSFRSTWRKRTWIFKPSLVVSGCEIG